GIEIREDRSEIAEALRQREAAREQNAFLPPDLHRALAPPLALRFVRFIRRRRDAVGERDIVIDRIKAGLVQLDRGVQVFGDGAGGKAADARQRPAPQHRARAAIEGCIPTVLAWLDNAEEQRLLGPELVGVLVPAMLEAVEIVEILRRLHD